MKSFQKFSVCLKWEQALLLDSSVDEEVLNPGQCAYATVGSIFLVDRGLRQHFAGEFQIEFLDVMRGLGLGMTVDEICEHSEYLSQMASELYDESDHLRAEVLDLLGSKLLSPNALLIERLALIPKYRGHGLGLRVLRALIQRFSHGAGIVAIRAQPLQFEAQTKNPRQLLLEEYSQNPIAASKALAYHFGKLGFKRMPKSRVSVISCLSSLPDLA